MTTVLASGRISSMIPPAANTPGVDAFSFDDNGNSDAFAGRKNIRLHNNALIMISPNCTFKLLPHNLRIGQQPDAIETGVVRRMIIHEDDGITRRRVRKKCDPTGCGQIG